MPFEIVRNDITKMHADAIVNSANPRPIIGPGTDSRIHEAAGPELLAARQKIGRIDPGCAAITPAFNLNAKYVIHTVGPVWDGGSYGEETLLRSCYDHSLALAKAHDCRSIAFPLIATGNYGFPRDKALQIAIAAFSAFLPEEEMQIYLVVFDRKAYQLSEKLFHSITSYIDQHYVDTEETALYGPGGNTRIQQMRRMDMDFCKSHNTREESIEGIQSLKETLRNLDAGFTETLLKKIDESGQKDSTIYKKALLSKQLFSKIRNNPNYKPTKETAIALALALEMNLEETNDLIGRAGYTLTNSSKFDLIIRYHIERKNFNIVQINMILYEFDQRLLGS